MFDELRCRDDGRDFEAQMKRAIVESRRADSCAPIAAVSGAATIIHIGLRALTSSQNESYSDRAIDALVGVLEVPGLKKRTNNETSSAYASAGFRIHNIIDESLVLSRDPPEKRYLESRQKKTFQQLLNVATKEGLDPLAYSVIYKTLAFS